MTLWLIVLGVKSSACLSTPGCYGDPGLWSEHLRGLLPTAHSSVVR